MRYFLQRFLQLVLVFIIVTFSVLVVMRIGSKDPVTMSIKLAGKPLTPQESAEMIQRYSLDSNFFVQYLTWVKNLIFHFDLGTSPQNSATVAALLKPRVWTTVLLGLYAIIFGLLIAIPVAVWQAYRRDRLFDKAGSMLTFVGVGIPGIVLGLFLKLLFVVHWRIFPSIGDKVYPWDNFGDHVMNFFLPTVTLMIPVAAIYARLLRADMVLTLHDSVSNGVRYYLDLLTRDGLINRTGKVSRGIRPTGMSRTRAPRFTGIPILGRVAAGQPILASRLCCFPHRTHSLLPPCDSCGKSFVDRGARQRLVGRLE